MGLPFPPPLLPFNLFALSFKAKWFDQEPQASPRLASPVPPPQSREAVVSVWLWMPADPVPRSTGADYHWGSKQQGFPGGSVVMNLPANVGDLGSIPWRREWLTLQYQTSQS